MKIDINKKEIEKNIGIFLTENQDYFTYIKVLIDKLESHNKNYTKEQYFEILQIKEILENIEIEN